MDDAFKLIADLGFPMAIALAAGYFIFLVLKFILDGVKSSIKGLSGLIVALDTLMSNALGVHPDLDRIARADGKNDARKD